jgi:proline racemase
VTLCSGLDTQRLLERLPKNRKARVVAVDTHTGGELTRVILSGGPVLPRVPIAELRTRFAADYDAVRKQLCWEPRGHRDLVVAWLTEPNVEGADLGVLFMDAQRYPLACGTATVGVITAAVEMGLVKPRKNKIVLDTPAGLVESRVEFDGERVARTFTDMVHACITKRDALIQVGDRKYFADLGFVGGYLLLVHEDQLSFPVVAAHTEQLVELGMNLVEEANRQWDVLHPRTGQPYTVDGVVFYDGRSAKQGSGTVVYGASHLDRSPCGTGTTVKMALLHARGELEVGDQYRNRGILSTEFVGTLTGLTQVGDYPGVKVRLAASASLVGFHEFFLTQGDPLGHGFILF